MSRNPQKVRKGKGKSLLEFPDDYVVIDLETTGLDSRWDSIIELGAIKYEHGREVGRFQSFVYGEVDEFISEMTGITNEMLIDAPKIEDALPQFLSFVGGNIVIGHNVNFDINFVYDNAERLQLKPFSNDFCDTMRISRRLYKHLPNHKLSTLCSSLNVPQPTEHRALSDCQRTVLCYEAMKQHVKTEGLSLRAPWENYSPLSKNIYVQSDYFILNFN